MKRLRVLALRAILFVMAVGLCAIFTSVVMDRTPEPPDYLPVVPDYVWWCGQLPLQYVFAWLMFEVGKENGLAPDDPSARPSPE